MNNLLNYFTEEELGVISRMKDLHLKSTVIVTELFKNKKDKAGYPYLWHLLRVSNRLDLEIEKIAGLLHDVLEDTEITEKDLLEVGIPKEIIDIVKIVTHDKIDKSNMTKEEKLELYNKEIDKVINSGNIHAIRLRSAKTPESFFVFPSDKAFRYAGSETFFTEGKPSSTSPRIPRIPFS